MPSKGPIPPNSSDQALGATVWKAYLKELREFHQEHGHTNVPPKYAENPALGSWVAELRKRGKSGVPRRWPEDPGLRGWVLRQRYRKDTLSAERIHKLDQLNFRWLGAERGKTRSELTGRFVPGSSDL